MPIVLAHGLEGSPTGSKATYLRTHGWPDLVAPDGRGQPLAPRVQGILDATAHAGPWIGIGSSYGGLAMLAAANQAPERFSTLLLLAPALMWSEPPVDDPAELLVPPGLTCHILHGSQDAIVPLAVSQRLVSRCADRCTLTIVDDTHALRNSMEAIATVLVQLERTLAQSGTIPVPQVR